MTGVSVAVSCTDCGTLRLREYSPPLCPACGCPTFKVAHPIYVSVALEVQRLALDVADRVSLLEEWPYPDSVAAALRALCHAAGNARRTAP